MCQNSTIKSELKISILSHRNCNRVNGWVIV